MDNWEQVKAVKSLQSLLGWKKGFPQLQPLDLIGSEQRKAVNAPCYTQDHHPHQGFYTLLIPCATTAQTTLLKAGKSQHLAQICCGLNPHGVSQRQSGF